MKNNPRPALFLDRDGCLIEEVNYLNQLEQIRLTAGAAQSLLAFHQAGYLLILITNQSGVARGYFDEAFVQKAHQHLQNLLKAQGVQLDGIYYCPHHEAGNPPYNQDCDCRKPNPGMIRQAQQDFAIDLEKSLMVGDKAADVELGQRLGMQSFLVLTGHGAKERSLVEKTFPQAQILASLADLRPHGT